MFKKKIGILQLILISLSAIIGLKNLPVFAEVGLSLIFFLSISTILFFIPIALIIAELSSALSHESGCYFWIKKAYGKHVAFIAIWVYWLESIIWFPTMLVFTVAMLAYTLNPIYPNLEKNTFFLAYGNILIFWILTLLNFYGIKISAKFSSSGVFFGTIMPLIITVTAGFYCFFKGDNTNLQFNLPSIVPDLSLNNLAFLSSILLGISGIEIISFYINDIENPGKNIAKVVIISSLLISGIYLLGSLSIAIIVPKKNLCFASDIIQAPKYIFSMLNIPFVTHIIAFLMFFGALSGMNTWVIGPAKGLLEAAKDDLLPKFLKKINKNGVPTNILILQALIGSLVSTIFFLYIKDINGLIWTFICLSFQFASILYIMISLSILKLRKLYPTINRPYKAPFVKILSILSISICAFTFLTTYVRPAEIETTEKIFYLILLLLSLIILILPAIIFSYIKYKKDKSR